MASTRKRTRRSLVTRRRRYQGGKKLTPFELLRAFNQARLSVEEAMKGNNDKKLKVFEEIKGFYYDNIPNMSRNDWTQLILKTPLQDPNHTESQNTPNENQNNSYESVVDDRFSDVVTVLTFWLEMRKQRANNVSSGIKGFFHIHLRNGKRFEKLDSSIKDIRAFIDWSLIYIDKEMYGPATKEWNSKIEARAFGRKHGHRNKMRPDSARMIEYFATLFPLVNTLRSMIKNTSADSTFKRYQEMKARLNDYESSGWSESD